MAELKIVRSIQKPLKMYCDNNYAVFFAKNSKRTFPLSLMDVKFLKVREKVKQGTSDVQHVSTSLVVADPLTKALPVGIFRIQISRMGVLESFDQ